MIQYKTFMLADPLTEKELNLWLKNNESMIEMRGDNKGPNIQVVGTVDPILTIQFNPIKGTQQYYHEAVMEEIQLRISKVFGSIQQLEEHRAKIKQVPEWEKQKGHKGAAHTRMWQEHNNVIEMTKRDILLQKAEISALKHVADNISNCFNGIFTDIENTMTGDEKDAASKSIRDEQS